MEWQGKNREQAVVPVYFFLNFYISTCESMQLIAEQKCWLFCYLMEVSNTEKYI